MAENGTLYSLEGISKRFKMTNGYVEVLHDLNLKIEGGKWAALVGRSGCGKTTLLHLLGGLDRPTAGKLLLDGEDLATMSQSKLTALRLKRIGFIFQSYHLFPELSALENAVLPALHWGMDRDGAEKSAKDWLEQFGLGKRLQPRPMELSGGEQQRVAIARALANNPSVIIADEPTGNLDPDRSLEIMSLLEKINDMGTTILVVTHERELVNRFGKRVVAIESGRIISDAAGGYYRNGR